MGKAKERGQDFRTVNVADVNVGLPSHGFGIQSKLENTFAIQLPKLNLDRITAFENPGATPKYYVHVSHHAREGSIWKQLLEFMRTFEAHIGTVVTSIWSNSHDETHRSVIWNQRSVCGDDSDDYLSLTFALATRLGRVSTPLIGTEDWLSLLYDSDITLVVKPNMVWYRPEAETDGAGVFGVKWSVVFAKAYPSTLTCEIPEQICS